MEHEPLLTVVTVVRNAAGSIAATLDSIARLKSPGVEYIVLDGNSSDGTQAVLRRFEAVIDICISEPDQGIYDAMNKAVRLARGRFVLNINAGDTLLRTPLDELARLGDEVTIAAFPVDLSSGRVFVPQVGRLLSITNTIHHQGACYRRAALRPYDLAYRTFSDFDLNQRLRAGAVAFPNAPAIATHSMGGQSHDRSHFHEVYAIVRKNRGAPMVLLTWLYFKFQGLRWRITSRFPASS